MADDEYYLDERPGGGSGQWQPDGGGDDGDGSGSGGGSGGSGSGGSGGGGRWDYWWDDPDGGDGGDDEQPGGGKPEWSDDEPSLAFLRLDNQGFLRLDPVGRILRGTRSCFVASSLIVYLAKEARTHSRCVLCKSSAPERMITLKSAADFLYEDFEPRPGRFELHMRWQGGHYDYSKISAVRIMVYGVDLGWVTLPLSRWMRVATVDVKDDYTIYVNHIKGSISGNLKYLK